jgi:glycosyltransferase involved in cell wall biosynthesis/SAM-dependent methyltransferase
MNVLIVLHEGALGGASRALLRPLPLLEERGFCFTFWVPRPSPVADHLVRRGHSVLGEPRPLGYSLAALREPPGVTARLTGVPGYLRRFRQLVAHTRPDLVYANTLLTLPEAMAARSTGATTVVHVHEMLGTGVRDLVAARLLGLATDAVATVSEAAAAPLRRHGLEPRVVTAGVERPAGAVRSRDGGRPVVGALGTVCARKGSDVFVAAAEEIARRGGDAEFRLVGPLAPGAERPWAQELVERAARAGVRWSTTSDPFPELCEWDLFALPTREDPFPLAVLEALAVGLPVVATDVGGLPEQVSPDTGVLVAPGKAVPLADAIESLLADPDRRQAMGERAAREAAERFTLERHADELERVCGGAVDAGESRRQAGGFRVGHRYPGPVPRTLQRSLRYGLLKTPLPFKRQIQLGLLRSYEWYTSSGRNDQSVDDRGHPLPPRKLRTLVAGRSDAEYFLDTGRRQAAFLRRLLERNGTPIESMSAVLDFGCGCGRIARWWWDLENVEVFGCDVNPELIAWARAELPFMNAAVSGESPPLPYPDDSFDFAYALSIFTHLPVESEGPWLRELRRVIKPGGLLLLTTAGESYEDRLSHEERSRYLGGEVVTQFGELAGTNLCITYHSPAYVREHMLEDGDELLEQWIPARDADEVEDPLLPQDAYLIRLGPGGKPGAA